MLKLTVLITHLLITGLNASGRQTNLPNYTVVHTVPHVPITKNSKEIESIITNLPRQGITIDEIKANQEKFSFTGTYKNEKILNDFIEKINAYSESKRNLTIKTHDVRFAGSDTHYFEITGDNQW